jgi:hypothetical protein
MAISQHAAGRGDIGQPEGLRHVTFFPPGWPRRHHPSRISLRQHEINRRAYSRKQLFPGWRPAVNSPGAPKTLPGYG